MASDRDTLAAAIRDRLDSWPNRSYLILPGPYDLSAELVDYLSRSLTGYRPLAQVIETPENGGDYSAAIAALDVLPSAAVVRVRHEVFQSIGSGWWETPGRRRSFSSEQVVDLADGDPVTVLLSPTEKAGQ